MSKFKIMVFTLPTSGHLNPLWPLLKELLNTHKYEILVYLDDKNKSKVELLGARFKSTINNFDPYVKLADDVFKADIYSLYKAFLDISKDNLEYIVSEIENEQPDLIIYDFMCLHFRWIASFYDYYYKLGKHLSLEEGRKLKFFPKTPLPDIVCFQPMFQDIKVDSHISFWTAIKLISFLANFFLFFGFKNLILSPFVQPEFCKKTFFCIVPDLQPKSHLYDKKKFRFLGSTVNENFIDPRAQEELFKNILEQNDYKLIYASLGTVLNSSVETNKLIIDAFKTFDQEPEESRNPSLKLNDFKVIVSVGEFTYNELNTMIQNGIYDIPNNIILVKSAPQIDILKKACLFVTHGGMNSTCESFHFGGEYKKTLVIL